jgi:hypothetical protein
MLQRDVRGHTPSAYAALRYGTASSVFSVMKQIADISQTDINMPLMTSLGRPHHMPAASTATATATAAAVDAYVSGEGGVGGGGWSAVPLQDRKLRGDVDRCDILEVSTG